MSNNRARKIIGSTTPVVLLVLPLLLCAAPDDKPAELPAPALLNLKPPQLPGQATETSDPFRLAVQEYVGRNDKEALAHLKEALRLKNSDDRAKQLLLKVYLRMLREKYESKDYKGAWLLLKESRKYFPAHPDLELMGRSIAQQLPDLPPEDRAKQQPPAATAKPVRPFAAPVPAASVKEAPVPAAAEKPLVITMKAPASLPWGRSPGDWVQAALGVVLLIAVGTLAYLLRQNRMALSQQAALFQEMLAREKEQRDEMSKKMDMELELVKRLEETVQQTHRRSVRDGDGGAENRSGGIVPPGSKPPAPRSPHMDKLLVSRQKKQIMDVLVNITPPEREEKEESIAAQAQSLYEISPSEAVKFLEGLARDESPLIRTIIVPALSKISTDETLNLLLDLRKDRDTGVQRAAYKQLKQLGRADPGSLLPGHFQKITEALHEEVNKGEWIL